MHSLNDKSEPSILIVAFNRPNSLKLLLLSLENAHYENKVRLIISIDGGGGKLNRSVKELALSYIWPYGEKEIIIHEVNLGLRNHILKAGNLTQDYGDIIMLEDDLYVSKLFYSYSKQALDYYRNIKEVAGISLYGQQYNETAGKPFYPLNSGKDTYFMQLASSWGQVWTAKQWKEFIEWYEQKRLKLEYGNHVPSNVKKWPETSWKKYFIKYLIEKNKFFVYPYVSLTTNMRALGVHAKKTDNLLQVPIYYTKAMEFSFSDLNDPLIKYDSFHENIELADFFQTANYKKIEVDLYGTKTKKDVNYLLTSKVLDYKIIKRYGLVMTPHELNVLNNIEGDDLFLYDISKHSSFPKKKKNYVEYRNFQYYFLKIKPGKKRVLSYFLNSIITKLDRSE